MEGRALAADGTLGTVCRQCDMRCGIEVTVESGKIARISGLKAHPQNRGRLCPKGPAAVDLVYHPERLRVPLKKGPDGSFHEVPLAQAMEEIAARVGEIRAREGARAVACWQGEALGFAQQEMYPRRFLHAFGSPNFFSVNSLCYVGRYLAYRLVQGYWNPCPDFARARLILIWGSNPPVSHMTFLPSIDEGRRRGARLVVIDPRRTEIARQADLHLRILPGTDGALAWGLIRRLVVNGSYDRRFVAEHTVGFQELAAYAQTGSFAVEPLSGLTGLPAAQIETCGAWLEESLPRVASYAGVSIEHQDNGVDTARVIACLGGLCGAVDSEGGDPWPEGLGENRLSLYEELPLAGEQPIGADRFPVLYDLYRECHNPSGLAAMRGAGPYPVRALLMTGANPANTNPNPERVIKALSALELLVVRDLFLTETARLADYVLPAASFLERTELHQYAHYQWLTLSRRILELPDVVDEYSFWRDLARRVGIGEYFPWEREEEVNRWLLEPTGIALGQLESVHEGLTYRPIRYRKFERDPEHSGMPFATPSGRFEFRSEYLEGLGYGALPRYSPPYHLRERSARYPFTLITGARRRGFLHSRYRNIPRLRRLHEGAELEIHPGDAAALGVRAGEALRVSSAVGAIILPVRILSEDDTLPGVVQITHGWEGEHNVNRLTFDEVFDPISGFPHLTSIPVRLEEAGGA
jgi:anaerobic selenocysteine-containing dehydrogenase